MRRIILFTLSFCLSLPLLSQTRGNISVCVRDSANKALQDVSALFFRGDSLVAGIATGKNGCFSLSLDTGNYVVNITHLGYDEYSGDIVLTPAGVRLPSIVLKEAAVELDAATVSQQTFSAESNKSLFKIPANVKSSTTDVYQVMATIPALRVNPIEKTASLAGSENSIITVNNIRRDKGYLSLLEPKYIDHVEIIRSPGSRYKNVDGIINIVTKAPVVGQSLYLYGRLEPTLEQGFSGGGYTYTGNKMSASLSFQNMFFDDHNGEASIVRDVTAGNDVIHTEKNSNSEYSSYISHSIGTNIDYTASPKTFSSFSFGYVFVPMESETPYNGSVNAGNGREYNFEALSKRKNDYEQYRMSFYLQSDFNKKNSMSIDANYNRTLVESNTLYRESNNSGHFYENRQVNNTGAHGLEAQVNFQHQLSKVKLEEGYRVYLDDNLIDNEINGVFNTTDHNEWRHYVYTNLLGELREKFVYQAGVGFDMSRVTLNNTLSVHNELTPNAMLRYIMKGGQNINFNYSLTRKSPPSSALNPIAQYVDSSRIITGNPDLKPYYLNVFGLSYELNKDKVYIQTGLRYNLANNYITSKEDTDENGVHHITYVNANRYSSATASLNVSYSIFNWWKITMDGSMRYNMYEDDAPQLNKNFRTYSAWLGSNINYKKLFVYINVPVNFRNETLTGYIKYTAESSIDVSYRLNNSWTITGMFRYLTPLCYKTETLGDGFSEIYYSNMTDRYLRLIFGFRYNFQKGKQQQYRQKKVKNYNDEANVGDTRSY